jgi:3-phenylpropionate/trans-cinnamate dioxygenase ferredoxin subunit
VESTDQNTRRVPVCRVADVPDGGAVRVSRELTGTDDDIALFNDGGTFYALNDTCTHALASLAEGWAEYGEVECPLHSGRFDLRTGAAIGLPANRDTVAHRVEVVDGAVALLLEPDR